MARSFSRMASQTSTDEMLAMLDDLAEEAYARLQDEGVVRDEATIVFEVDMRYSGQAFEVPMTIEPDAFRSEGLEGLMARFDAEHERMFHLHDGKPHEVVNLRVVALGREPDLPAAPLPKGDGDPAAAKIRDHRIWIGGSERDCVIYDRSKLRQGDILPGPAIITEMDSTTLIEHDCVGTIDHVGSILINPR